MYRVVLLSNPQRMRRLCAVLDTNNDLGRWVKAIYVYRDYRGSAGHDLTGDVLRINDCIVSLVRHCTNLQYFTVEHPVGPDFSSVADSLWSYCASTLKSVLWCLPYEAQGKIVPFIHSLRHLVSLEIHLTHPLVDTSDRTSPAIRSYRDISFPHLEQLSLRGYIQDFAEQIPSWDMPLLHDLTLDFETNRHDFPDILEVLETHGPQLTALDINCIPTLNVPSILSLCPELKTFCFNLDWQLEGILTVKPHPKLQWIGLYGLRYAFGVGYANTISVYNPFDAIIMRRRNDVNFAALDKTNFPLLKTIRVLDCGLLRDLNKEDGPAKGVCYDRWERWWEQCAMQGVSFEDCTGSPLGTLPQKEDDDDELYDSDEEEDVDEGHAGDKLNLNYLASRQPLYSTQALPGLF